MTIVGMKKSSTGGMHSFFFKRRRYDFDYFWVNLASSGIILKYSSATNLWFFFLVINGFKCFKTVVQKRITEIISFNGF